MLDQRSARGRTDDSFAQEELVLLTLAIDSPVEVVEPAEEVKGFSSGLLQLGPGLPAGAPTLPGVRPRTIGLEPNRDLSVRTGLLEEFLLPVHRLLGRIVPAGQQPGSKNVWRAGRGAFRRPPNTQEALFVLRLILADRVVHGELSPPVQPGMDSDIRHHGIPGLMELANEAVETLQTAAGDGCGLIAIRNGECCGRR